MPPKSKKASGKRRLIFEDPEEEEEKREPSPTTTPPSSSTPPKKRQRASFQSPQRKSKKTATVVTPEAKEEEYVPKYIHKNVHYLRKNQGKLPKHTRQTYDLVCEHYEIPTNFEQSHSYGPLSGTTYEERVVQEYVLGKLNAKDDAVEICTCCATLGHMRDDCPTLV